MHLWLCSCDGMHVSRLISDENSQEGKRRENQQRHRNEHSDGFKNLKSILLILTATFIPHLVLTT